MAVSSILHSLLLQGSFLVSLLLSLAVHSSVTAATLGTTTVCQDKEYRFLSTPKRYDDALSECEYLGTTWSLATVLSSSDGLCVNSLTRGHQVWLGLRTINYKSVWASGEVLSLHFYSNTDYFFPANYCTVVNSSAAAGVPSWTPVNCSLRHPYLCQQTRTSDDGDAKNMFDISNTFQVTSICVIAILLIVVIVMAVCLVNSRNRRLAQQPLAFFPAYGNTKAKRSPSKPDNWIEEDAKLKFESTPPTKESVFSPKSSGKYDMDEWEDNPFYAHVDKDKKKERAGPSTSSAGSQLQALPSNSASTHVRLNCYENTSAEQTVTASNSHASVATTSGAHPVSQARCSVATLVKVRGSSCASEMFPNSAECQVVAVSENNSIVEVDHTSNSPSLSMPHSTQISTSPANGSAIDTALLEKSKEKSAEGPSSLSSEPGFFNFVRKYTSTTNKPPGLSDKSSETALLDAECGMSPVHGRVDDRGRPIDDMTDHSKANDGLPLSVGTSTIVSTCSEPQQHQAVYAQVSFKTAAKSNSYAKASIMENVCSKDELYDEANVALQSLDKELDMLGLEFGTVNAEEAFGDEEADFDPNNLVNPKPKQQWASASSGDLDVTPVDEAAFNVLDELDRTLDDHAVSSSVDGLDETLDDLSALDILDELNKTLDDLL